MLSFNSAYNRAYSLFYMSVAAFVVVAGVGALMAAFYKLDPDVDFSVSKVDQFGRSSRGFEEAVILFNVTADFSKLVHVNTRLFFAYIEAEWKSGRSDEHRSILWNQLVYKENPLVSFTDLPGNFTLRQVGPSIKGKDVQLTFKFQLVPYIGFFRTKSVKSLNLTLPKEYVIKHN